MDWEIDRAIGVAAAVKQVLHLTYGDKFRVGTERTRLRRQAPKMSFLRLKR